MKKEIHTNFRDENNILATKKKNIYIYIYPFNKKIYISKIKNI